MCEREILLYFLSFFLQTQTRNKMQAYVYRKYIKKMKTYLQASKTY